MALQLTPELERRLEYLALETNHSANEMAQSAMSEYIVEMEELIAAVKEADDQFARGETIPHEEVVAQMRRRFEQR